MAAKRNKRARRSRTVDVFKGAPNVRRVFMRDVAAEQGGGAMKASAQLDAFPASDNARRRQSSRHKAVVSIRLSGATIAALDAEAKRASEGERDYRCYRYVGGRVTRSDVVERAVMEWLRAAKQGGAS